MKPYYDEDGITIYHGDCREVLQTLDAESVNCCVTSPPYFGLRDYGHAGQIGLEQTPDEYVAQLVGVFRDVRRVLRDDGTLWLNLGDSYGGPKGDKKTAGMDFGAANIASRFNGTAPKQLLGIPWRVAFALQADGWYLRQDIIWHKPNPMPESVTDRCTKAHEYIFLLAKSERYYYDAAAIAEKSEREMGGPRVFGAKLQQGTMRQDIGREFVDNGKRNRRSVWTVTTKPYSGAHFATFPPDLIDPCIAAGVPDGGTVLDPFFGAGTTGLVAQNHHVNCIGIELNEKYCEIAARRLAQGVLPFAKE